MKVVFVDVGELGWSLYLSAHMRWLKETKHPVPPVMVIRGRECLYEGLAPVIFPVSDSFYAKFNMRQQNRFTIYGTSGGTLKRFLNSRMPEGYRVSEEQPFDCNDWRKVFWTKMLFKSYPYRLKLVGPREILVFPRWRTAKPFRSRNLSMNFYESLIIWLCNEFKHHTIRTLGTLNGAYNITSVVKPNYVNSVGKTAGIQDVIDRYQLADVAIGSQSATLKLALLQGVPSFMIGHERERHVVRENWRRTRAGFYETHSYSKFNSRKCADEVISFVKEITKEKE